MMGLSFQDLLLNAHPVDKICLLYTSGQTDTYILKGGDKEEWEPKFTWHTFRKVEVVSRNTKISESSLIVKDVYKRQGVTWANTTKESPYGTIIVNWKLQDDCLMMHVGLPVGVEASVAIPSNANKGVVNGQEVKLDKQYLELGTGTYDIEIRQL